MSKKAEKFQPPLWKYYRRVFHLLGPQHWWPAKTRLEVVLGAVLTQNTGWQNAATALRELRRKGWHRLAALRKAPGKELARAIRPAGFYRQKALTIRNFLNFLHSNCGGSLNRMFRRPTAELRKQLLSVRGLGPETVDSILVYAGRRPSFIVDAYTRRVLERHHLIEPRTGYDQIQALFHGSLPPDAQLFNEYHALIVEIGKRYCRRSNPDCSSCPLEPFLPPQEMSEGRSLEVLSHGASSTESRTEGRRWNRT